MRGATGIAASFGGAEKISIHAPLAGCDPDAVTDAAVEPIISIHAPHTGCDRPSRPSRLSCFYFNPRTPCGVRHRRGGEHDCILAISIHAPHTGCDNIRLQIVDRRASFNPRTPCGVRQFFLVFGVPFFAISIHAPARGATRVDGCCGALYFISIHAPARGATLGVMLPPCG